MYLLLMYMYWSKEMKDREIACIHYLCEGQCDLNKEGTFRKHCQTCKSYKKKPGGKPARTDTRKKRQFRIDKRELRAY